MVFLSSVCEKSWLPHRPTPKQANAASCALAYAWRVQRPLIASSAIAVTRCAPATRVEQYADVLRQLFLCGNAVVRTDAAGVQLMARQESPNLRGDPGLRGLRRQCGC